LQNSLDRTLGRQTSLQNSYVAVSNNTLPSGIRQQSALQQDVTGALTKMVTDCSNRMAETLEKSTNHLCSQFVSLSKDRDVREHERDSQFVALSKDRDGRDRERDARDRERDLLFKAMFDQITSTLTSTLDKTVNKLTEDNKHLVREISANFISLSKDKDAKGTESSYLSAILHLNAQKDSDSAFAISGPGNSFSVSKT
jgi:hypothetical protein